MRRCCRAQSWGAWWRERSGEVSVKESWGPVKPTAFLCTGGNRPERAKDFPGITKMLALQAHNPHLMLSHRRRGQDSGSLLFSRNSLGCETQKKSYWCTGRARERAAWRNRRLQEA